MTRSLRLRRWILVPLAAVPLLVGVSAPASAVIAAPTPVAAKLATFPTDPQGAMTAWVDWAKGQPMRYSTTAVDGKVVCKIDAVAVTKCVGYNPNLSGKGYVKAYTNYTLANHRTQVFTFKGKWVKNNFGADTNPFTNTDRYYPQYDYWLPWLTPGVPVTTSVAADGWYVVRSQNLKVGDDQYAVTVVRVAPDGSRAQFLQQTDKGTTEVATGITITEVPAINVPSAVKQQL